MKRVLCLALTLAALAAPIRAENTAVYDVMQNRGQLLGWEAVGRLDLGGRGFCTGALISSDVVLTAAHCVYDRTSGAPYRPRDLVFRAGYHRGEEITARRVLRFVTPDGYAAARHNSAHVALDVALLKLEAPVSSAEADPFRLRKSPANGTAVSVVSYGRGREEVLSREPDCSVVNRYRDGVFGFDCDVTFGSSGSPVFTKENGRLRILSVISSINGRGEAYGPLIAELVPDLAARLRRDDARAPVTTGARRITVGGGDRGATGARFVRP